MSDGRKEKEYSKEHLLETIGSWRALLRKRSRWGDKPIIWPDEEIYQQLCRLIQQKPEIDDMKKYVNEKAWELSAMNLFFCVENSEDYAITIEKARKFITQIIGDAKGR